MKCILSAIYYFIVLFAQPVLSQWPMPQQMTETGTLFSINPSHFQFKVAGPGGEKNCDVIEQAIVRYQDLTFLNDCSKLGDSKKHKPSQDDDPVNSKILSNLTIWINHPCEVMPHQDMDEMYTIRVGSEDFRTSAVILANSVWGALRGLETFSQLVKPSKTSESMFEINGTFILDYPRFPFRGLLLDTSRHFLPVKVIYGNLDAMAYNKMNVFHWHIVDDDSFPFVSETFPELTEKGAFDPKTHIYSPKDVADVIEYARVRGIRVIPEFDTPGHIQSWGESQVGLITACNNTSVFSSPMDPTKEKNYVFLQKFLAEVSNVFPENYIHLGGDEVNFDCWNKSKDVQDFMKHHNITTFEGVQSYHMKRVTDIMDKLNRSYIVWQEVFDNKPDLNKQTVVQVWLGHAENHTWDSETLEVTSKGFRVVLSSPWYLNYITYGVDWPSFYNQEPVPSGADENQAKLVLGGEVCMWGEHVDGSNCIQRTWPRSSAVAERLWSAKVVNITNSNAVVRISEQQCRMQMRGLKVEPINGPGFCKCDYMLV